MRQLLAILLFFAFFSVTAQELSVGARTGVGHSFYLRTGNYKLPSNTTWDKQLFLRYQSNKWLAIELGFEHYRCNDQGNNYSTWTHIGTIHESWKRTDNYMIIYFTAQYNFSHKSKAPGLFDRFRHYLGFTPSLVFIGHHSRAIVNNLSEDRQFTRNTRSTHAAIYGGLTYTLAYTLSNHLALSSSLAYKFDLLPAFSTEISPFHSAFNNHMGLQVGLGYSF